MVLTANTFTNNIGTFGGALSINSPNWQNNQSPYVILRSNYFANNMAYFSGNAVYIRSTLLKANISFQNCGGVDLESNTFVNNIGMKIHNGGAVSASCMYIVDKHSDDF